MSAADETAIQALSTAGAFCGECGFEPGDRGCPDCERTWAGYVRALRAAGWAARIEAIRDRDAQIIEWLTKKAHEEGTSNKERRTRADVLFRMADKMSRGAVRPPLSKGPDPVIELSKSEQQFLAFALELAADQIASRGDEADEAALEKLRTLTGEVTS
ncbi:hypothetical protein SGL43_06644 [Streptomyces globisporus]|uniref:Uncharacterized protein n=1 Tax=Streptomyces globisporus TaxID=1908 RepID=A0ABN8VD47_STRGL|nr:hypothetical protein [Streptomyces globisporus]CAH9419589.1 hypothetical protein SGL43_06644 [Streptomyces globisporus]